MALTDIPEDELEEQDALIAALRQQEARQQEERTGLQRNLTRQQGQAGNLRTLSLLTSLGQNPLLEGIQRASGQQGAQLEGLAGRTEQRLAGAGQGMDPLALARLRQSSQRLAHQRGTDAEKLELARRNLARLQGQTAAIAGAREEKRAGDLIERETGLRKEVQNHPVVKEYQLAAIAFDKVQEAAANPSPANDLALIFGYMKTLDPTSAVREGEFANAQNAGGVPDRILNAYNRAVRGERLNPEQRAEFVKSASGQFAATKSRAQAIIDGYKGVAESTGVVPDRVVMPGTVVPDVNLDAPPEAPKRPDPGAAKTPPPPLDDTKKATRTVFSKDGKWVKEYYSDGTTGVGPASRRRGK